MVTWNVSQSVVKNISNISALHRIGCIWTSVVLVRIYSMFIDIISVDTFETGSFKANAKATNAAEQVDKCGCHDPRLAFLARLGG